MTKGHNFPKSIIIQFRFGLSYREIEELMPFEILKSTKPLYKSGCLSSIHCWKESLESKRNVLREDEEWTKPTLK